MRPRRSSIRKHLDALAQLFRNHALPVGTQIQKANAIIRGFCNHYRSDHSSNVFRWLTNWTLRSFCKWVSRRSGKMTREATNLTAALIGSSPKRQVIKLFTPGISPSEAAAELDASRSHISQFRDELQAVW